MPIEVEAQSLEQVDEALAAGADIILLDNLSIERHQRGRAAHRRARARSRSPAASRSIAFRSSPTTGADYVSVGALTHSAPAADLSFELEPDSDPPSRTRMSEPLPADSRQRSPRARIAAALSAAGRVLFAEIGSTNDVAPALAEARRAGGSRRRRVRADGGPRPARPRVVLAAGRRTLRLGRLSAVRRAAPLLTLAGGVAVADGIRARHRLAGRRSSGRTTSSSTVAHARAAAASSPASSPKRRPARRPAVRRARLRHQPAAGGVSAGARRRGRRRSRPSWDGRRRRAWCSPRCSPRSTRRSRALEAGDGAPLLARWRALAPSAIGAACRGTTTA